MARSLAGASALVGSLSESVALFVNRRGYAAAGAAATAGRGASEKKTPVDSSAAARATASWSDSWVPDPVTGYYRPKNLRSQPDSAELRETALDLSKKQ